MFSLAFCRRNVPVCKLIVDGTELGCDTVPYEIYVVRRHPIVIDRHSLRDIDHGMFPRGWNKHPFAGLLLDDDNAVAG